MQRVDVVIVGASVAGCVAAIGFARAGLAVLVLDKMEKSNGFKALCTHFIQPIALPILARLDLLTPAIEAGAVPTKAAFYTGRRWIDPPGPYREDARYALNIERRTLDPFLRKRVLEQPGAELRLRAAVHQIRRNASGYEVAFSTDGEAVAVRARLVVAADGRGSLCAKVLANEARESPNDRAVVFAYCDGIGRPTDDRSLFYRIGREFAFLYPLCAARTLLCLAVEREKARAWRKRGSLEGELLSAFNRCPDLPSFRNAGVVSPVYGYDHYPNLRRDPVVDGVPFIGDAALSLDAVAGVGCGFAIVTAGWLVNETAGALVEGGALDAGLANYRRLVQEQLEPHAAAICKDSVMPATLGELKQIDQFFEVVTGDVALQRAFIAYTGRLLLPKSFQRTYLSSYAKGRHGGSAALAS